jgi:hypothetical protein
MLMTAAEVDKAIAAQLTQIHERIDHPRRQKVEALVAEQLLAKEADFKTHCNSPTARGRRRRCRLWASSAPVPASQSPRMVKHACGRACGMPTHRRIPGDLSHQDHLWPLERD